MKIFLRFLFGLLTLVVLAVGVVWFFPGLVIRQTTLLPILKYFVPGDWNARPEVVEIDSRGLFAKHFRLVVSDIEWKSPDGRVAARRLLAEGIWNFRLDRWLSLKELKLDDGEFAWKVAEETTPAPTPKKKEDSLALPSPPEFLNHLLLEHVAVQLRTFQLELPGAKLSGQANLVTGTADPQPLLRLLLNAQLAGGRKVETDLNAKLWLPERRIDVTLSGSASGLAPQLKRLTVASCRMQYNGEDKDPHRALFFMNCPVAVQADLCPPAKAVTAPPSARVCKGLIQKTEARLIADLKLAPDGKKRPEAQGKIELTASPLYNLGTNGEGEAQVLSVVKFRPLEFTETLSAQTEATVKLAHFQRVARELETQRWPIPAPFNSLDGELSVSAKMEGTGIAHGAKFPLVLNTALESASQRIATHGEGELQLTRSPAGDFRAHLDFVWSLNDVQLALPKLSPTRPPRAFPDGRLESGKAAAAAGNEPSSFTYNIKLRTESQPLRILTNLAGKPVPVSLRLEMSSEQSPHGVVRLAAFPVEVFRRKGTVQSLELFLKTDARYNEIRGRLEVPYNDYTVFVNIMGLASEPQIRFESEPPLSEEEAVAVLIYGKRPETLSSDEAASVGNTRAALQNRALNLASMYLLASTPVESIGYDPLSESFNARIKLKDGTSLMVGTDFKEINQLGVRQRLGKSWAINTYLNDPFAVVNRTLTALLEWSVGY